jgi:uncharacterized protein (DUF362 family)/NAD-dependent dihydropyrimidine dehydrogenase PreA subunit
VTEKSRVVLVRCTDYDPVRVEEAMHRGMELLGDLSGLVPPGEPVLLKPNLLAPNPPAKGVTTHPSVFRAAIRLFQAAGSLVTFGDSPAAGSPAFVARAAGLLPVAIEHGVELVDFITPVEVPFPQGRQHKKFTLAKGVVEHHGALVSLPKFKTHGLVRMTCAVKNLFGCIPGLLKAEFHVKLPNAHPFARMLVDLNLLLRARLHIVDGIQAMQGNGPRSGEPYPLQVLAMSTDPVALDAVLCRLVGVDPTLPPTAKYGLEYGLGTFREAEIEILGEIPAPKRHFTANRVPPAEAEPMGAVRWLKNLIVPRPVISARQCTHCGNCVKICPVTPKALDWHQGDRRQPPRYDYDRCIRCYCCQELCPERAIRIRTPWLGRLIRRG